MSNVDWQHVLDTAGISIEELKRRLPLQYVVGEAGVGMEPAGDRLIGLCPFHLDENPSFSIFGEDLDRVGCWSCDFGTGDVLDFIGRWKDLDLRGSLSVALQLLQDYEKDSEWQPLAVQKPQPVLPEVLLEEARSAYRMYEADSGALVELLRLKGLQIPPDWLHQEWFVGIGGASEVVVPHFDKDRVVTGIKSRSGLGHLYGRPGSRFGSLYGAWRGAEKDVILVEGESDAWWVSWVLRNEKVSVYGLPRGAGAVAQDDWVNSLRDKTVVLMFDGDGAGRGAARRWHEALNGVAEQVRVASVGAGQDACDLSESEVLNVVNTSVEIRVLALTIMDGPGGYVRVTNAAPVTDWKAQVVQFLDFSGGDYGFELRIGGRRQIITSSDFMSDSSIRKWCNERRLSWWGTVKDAQSLLHLFNSEKPFLLHQKATRKVGWHTGSFVWPGGVIGKESWIYAGGAVSGEFKRTITLGAKRGDVAAVLQHLLGLHRRDIVSPVLGWMAAALVRPEWRVFPPLAVVGGSGTGKTTFVDAVLGAFGFGGGEHNLTSTTPYGLSMMAAGSCGVPVWFDEYRPGARKDTLQTMEQVLRDAWTGSSSMRGGVGKTWSDVVSMEVSAPLVISGEDMFSETSLLERVVLVRMPQDVSERSSEALSALRREGQIGSQLLEWMTSGGFTGAVDPRGGSRPEIGRSVVSSGWGMLRRFGVEVGGYDIGEIDLGDVATRTDEALRIDPYLELVVAGSSERDFQLRPLVWVTAAGVVVRSRALVAWARQVEMALPGGERAFVDWLSERYPGSKRFNSENGLALLLGSGSLEEFHELSKGLD